MLRDLANAKKMNEVITEVLLFILSILISTFVLRFAWNQSLVKHISALKSITGNASIPSHLPFSQSTNL